MVTTAMAFDSFCRGSPHPSARGAGRRRVLLSGFRLSWATPVTHPDARQVALYRRRARPRDRRDTARGPLELASGLARCGWTNVR